MLLKWFLHRKLYKFETLAYIELLPDRRQACRIVSKSRQRARET